MQIFEELQSLQEEGRLIKVGLVGAGFMGRGIVEVLDHAPGMTVAAVADKTVDRALSALELVEGPPIRVVERAADARLVDLQAERVASQEPAVISALEGVDMVIEATGKTEVGAAVAFQSIIAGKHVGMLNVETDVTVGHLLASMARRSGVVYTVCAGDEPAALKELFDFAATMGFTVVACGKGKNNPLDQHANPETLSGRAAAMGLNPAILTEFVDGTKTMVEMCCVANAAGLTVDVPNMHGPDCDLDRLAETFSLKSRGGLLAREGVVDFAIGNVAPGVFAVVSHAGEIANQTLRYLKIGTGPQYLLYRPYHLTNLEVPHTVGWAALRGKPTVTPRGEPRTEVTTRAKKGLAKGREVDGLGGFTVYGGLREYQEARRAGLLPMGLAEGARLVRDVAADRELTYGDVELRNSLLLQLRKIQDDMHA
ncbi:MAG: NAD(P)H-dependent oxidoreductase [Spirochaetota bacterium]